MNMRRVLASLAVVLALALALGGSAAAQIDLGNDGIDMDCADFAELNAAQGYFVGDGGSAARKAADLDPTGDGLACEAADQAIEDTGDGGVDLDGDGDGLIDEQELQIGTDPDKYDTDGDGYDDGDEFFTYGTDPKDPNSVPDGGITLDGDNDGLMDEEELEIGTDPTNPDTDGDRLSDGFEYREFGTDPLKWDTDGDGYGDGDELEVHKTDPLDPNSRPRGEEPAPTKPTPQPVKGLPNTGAGALTTGDSIDGATFLLVAAGLVLALAGATGVMRRRA